MRTLTAMLTLLMIIGVLLLPVLMIIWGFAPGLPVWLRIALVAAGLLLCRIIKPLSIFFNVDE